jgi:hypothetical protein
MLTVAAWNIFRVPPQKLNAQWGAVMGTGTSYSRRQGAYDWTVVVLLKSGGSGRLWGKWDLAPGQRICVVGTTSWGSRTFDLQRLPDAQC